MSFSALAGTWSQEGVDWKYYNDNGTPVYSDWLFYNENWYYFNGSGAMVTGWVRANNAWYFLHDDGTMAHDTWIGDYYVNTSGKWSAER